MLRDSSEGKALLGRFEKARESDMHALRNTNRMEEIHRAQARLDLIDDLERDIFET